MLCPQGSPWERQKRFKGRLGQDHPFCCGLDQAPSLIQPNRMGSLRRLPVTGSFGPTCPTSSLHPSSRVSPLVLPPIPRDLLSPPSWLGRPCFKLQTPSGSGVQTLVGEAGHRRGNCLCRRGLWSSPVLQRRSVQPQPSPASTCLLPTSAAVKETCAWFTQNYEQARK